MALAHVIKNTDKEFPCVNCGSQNVSIVREGTDPRLKCNAPGCGFTFNGSDSLDAKAKGSIPDAPPVLQDPSPERTPDFLGDPNPLIYTETVVKKLPRTLSYVIVSKDRTKHEFCNTKELKKLVLKWETSGKPYEVFELQSKQITARVDIQ